MGWETRNGKGRYYTRSLWRDGRVFRVYFGAGIKGERAAARHEEERRQREAAMTDWLDQQTRWQSAAEPLLALGTLTDQLLHATLQAAGYHQHHRGDWRRRRGLARKPSVAAIEAIVEDSAWRLGLDLARQAQRCWLALLAEHDLLLEVGAERQLTAWMKALPRVWPERLGQLLQHRVVLAQLRLSFWNGQQARQPHGPRSLCRLAQQQHGQAQRDFHRAIKAHLLLRRFTGHDQTGGGVGVRTRSPTPDQGSHGR